MDFFVDCTDLELSENIKKELNDISPILEKLFRIKNVNFNIIVHDSRISFERNLGRKTEVWEVGNTKDNTINILSKKIFESQSSHKEEEFYPILNHEVIHIFYFTKFKTGFPFWLNEGLCSYYGTPKKGRILHEKVEELKTLSFANIHTPQDFRKIDSKIRYEIVYSIIKKIIDDFGESNLQRFLDSLKKPQNQEEIEMKFKEVFSKTSKDFLEEWLSEIENKISN